MGSYNQKQTTKLTYTNMKTTFATIAALAAIEGFSQVNALSLEAAINAAINA